MTQRCETLAWLAALMLVVALGATASAQDNNNTVGEFWPEVNAHIQLPDNWRLLTFVGLKKGEDFPYHQLYAGLGLVISGKRLAGLIQKTSIQTRSIRLYLAADMNACKR